jgi:hypothetical protein
MDDDHDHLHYSNSTSLKPFVEKQNDEVIKLNNNISFNNKFNIR